MEMRKSMKLKFGSLNKINKIEKPRLTKKKEKRLKLPISEMREKTLLLTCRKELKEYKGLQSKKN